MEDVIGIERDAALGNGGLGRLAACFLDSLASLDYPAWGYGLRYRYGIFKQEIINGYQVEVPDYWLDFNPWEFPRHDVTVDIQFYGHVRKYNDENGRQVSVWENGEIVTANAYDVPIPGYNTPTTNNLLVVGVGLNLVQEGKVLEEVVATKLGSDELGQLGVSLVQPAARSDAVGDVGEFVLTVDLDEVLEDGGLDQIRMQLGDTIDLVRAYNGKEGHADHLGVRLLDDGDTGEHVAILGEGALDVLQEV